MSDGDSSFSVGDSVMARFTDGKWYAAEIVKIAGDQFQVQWFGDGKRTRLNRDQIEPIPNRDRIVHSHDLGAKVICEFDDVWYTGKVTGIVDVGYYVDWENGDDRIRVLESEAISLPTQPIKAGSKVLAMHEKGVWYAATLRAVFGDGVEIAWADGSGIEPLAAADVIAYPVLSAAEELTATELAGRSDVEHLQIYLSDRVRAGEVTGESTAEEQYCPNCKTRHLVSWFKDKAYDIKFFICSVDPENRIVVLSSENGGYSVLTGDQLLTKYPAVAREQRTLLRKIFGATEVQMSPFPPFVTLVFGRGKNR